MDGPLARLAVVGTAHRPAVDGRHFPWQQLGHRSGPLHETPLELLRVQPGEDLAESVVGRDAVGQFQEGPEPLFLALAGQFHVDPGVSAADDRTNCDGNDVQQLMPLAAVHPGVIQPFEIVHNEPALWLLHHSPSSSHHIRRLPCLTQGYHL